MDGSLAGLARQEPQCILFSEPMRHSLTGTSQPKSANCYQSPEKIHTQQIHTQRRTIRVSHAIIGAPLFGGATREVQIE